MSCPEISAVQDKVAIEKGKELREPIAIPIPLVTGLEILCYHNAGKGEDRDPSTLYVWWILLMIYGSLRFDDALHVCPEALEFDGDALRGFWV